MEDQQFAQPIQDEDIFETSTPAVPVQLTPHENMKKKLKEQVMMLGLIPKKIDPQKKYIELPTKLSPLKKTPTKAFKSTIDQFFLPCKKTEGTPEKEYISRDRLKDSLREQICAELRPRWDSLNAPVDPYDEDEEEVADEDEDEEMADEDEELAELDNEPADHGNELENEEEKDDSNDSEELRPRWKNSNVPVKRYADDGENGQHGEDREDEEDNDDNDDGEDEEDFMEDEEIQDDDEDWPDDEDERADEDKKDELDDSDDDELRPRYKTLNTGVKTIHESDDDEDELDLVSANKKKTDELDNSDDLEDDGVLG